MGKNGKPLAKEKGKNLAFRKSDFYVTLIVKKISRCRSALNNILQNPEVYANSKRTGRPPKLSPTTLSRLFWEASEGEKNSRNFLTRLEVTSKSVHQILLGSKNFVCKNKKKAPAPTKNHSGWRGLLMILEAFYSNGKNKLIEMKDKQNAMKYTEILENILMPFIQLHEQDEVIFQLDNTIIHTAKHTKTAYLIKYQCSGLTSKISGLKSHWKFVRHPIKACLSKMY